MDNLGLWEKVRTVPETAKKEIQAGRLRGMTDINPVYRLKLLTEQFGPCGIGWWYEITDKHMERTDSGEVAAFVDINLYYTLDGVTSLAVPGTGGSAFIAQEKGGLHVSDECYKMALTDAISVACKALGVGADVYWDKDNTKYTKSEEAPPPAVQKPLTQRIEDAAPPLVTRGSQLDSIMRKYGVKNETLTSIIKELHAAQKIGPSTIKDMPHQEFLDTLLVIEGELVDRGYKAV